MAKLTDAEIRSLVDQEAAAALGYVGKLAEARRRSMEFYMGRANGELAPAEVEGRSSVVSPDVANAVEWAMPSLMRIFASGEKIVTFEPRKPGDEPKADLATDYCNHLFWVKNHGFAIAYSWIKDALLQKNGIVKVFCEDKTETSTEEYQGLTEGQMHMLAGDKDVEVLESSAYHDTLAQMPPQPPQMPGQPPAPMPMLYDLKIRRTSKEPSIRVINVPPEEFLVSRLCRQMQDDTFKGHRVLRTLGELIAMGYPKDQVLKLTDDNNWSQYNGESIERRVYDDEYATSQTTHSEVDPLMRKVWLIEGYLKCDYEGKGELQWRKIVKAGWEILENEECDGPPFVDMCPIIMPHRFFGLSMADITMEWQKVKTALVRQLMDALYLGNNPRYEAVEGQVNLDDLLTSRPGGVVRVKQGGSVQALQTADVSGQALAGIQYIDQVIDERTGVASNNQGLDPAILAKTPVGTMDMAQQASMQKLELIARVFAECGFANLFRLMLKFILRYQDKPAMMRINGQWADIDPREWADGFDMSVSVGLGTGNRTAQAAQITQIVGMQQALMQIGVTTPQNIYHAAKKLPQVLGYKDAEQFFNDPSKSPPPQHQDTAQMQMQIEQMKAQMKAQTDQAAKQSEMQLERERMQMQAQVDTHRQQVEAQQKQLELQAQRELEQFKAQMQMQVDQMKAELARQTAIDVARIKAEASINAAQLSAQSMLTSQQDAAADQSVEE